MFVLVFLGVIVGPVVYLAVRRSRIRGRTPPGPRSPESARSALPPAFAAMVAEWVSVGLISEEQSTLVLAHEQAKMQAAFTPAAARRPRRRVPAVAEALGYLGGMLVVGSLVVLTARYWSDISTAGRLGLSGGAAMLFFLGGVLTHESTAVALARLRAFLWLASSSAFAVFAVVAARDGFRVERTETLVIYASAAVAVESGLLWWGRQRPLQQLAFLAAAISLLGSAVAQFTEPPGWAGVAVWASGCALLLLGLRRVISAAVATETLGALAMLAGGIMIAGQWQGFGMVLVVATAAGLASLAVVRGLAPEHEDQLTLGILAAVALLQSVPMTLGYFASDAGGATGLATYVIGALLVYVGGRQLVRVPEVVEIAGGTAMLGGAALTFSQWHGFAPAFGTVTAIGLIALGTLSDRLLMSLLGSLGLLVDVPWALTWFFPGQGRVPMLTLTCGALIIAIAVFLNRITDRFHSDLRIRHRHP